MSGYYSEHASEYIESTITTDMSRMYEFFLPHVKNGGSILDVGFGSARDMLHFRKEGYRPFGIDIEPEFVRHANFLGLSAEVADVMRFEPKEKFDGIWACASLLHLKKNQLLEAINRLRKMLTPDGILFVSMKIGEGEGLDEKERWMSYVSESDFDSLPLIDSMKTVEQGRGITWLSLLIRH